MAFDSRLFIGALTLTALIAAFSLSQYGAIASGKAISALEITDQSAVVIYGAFAFAIIVLGMFLVYLSKEIHSHTELIEKIEEVERLHEESEEKHHGREPARSSMKISEQKPNTRRLKEIKKLVREIKKL